MPRRLVQYLMHAHTVIHEINKCQLQTFIFQDVSFEALGLGNMSYFQDLEGLLVKLIFVTYGKKPVLIALADFLTSVRNEIANQESVVPSLKKPWCPMTLASTARKDMWNNQTQNQKFLGKKSRICTWSINLYIGFNYCALQQKDLLYIHGFILVCSKETNLAVSCL